MKNVVETEYDPAEIVKTLQSYKTEATLARNDRKILNERNFDFYHLKQDFAHKKTGQSREFLPKQSMAVEQITSFMHQGLIDLGEWFSISATPGNKQPLFTDEEARLLLSQQLEKADFFSFVQDAIKGGLLGSLMIAKVSGKFVESPVFFTTKKGFLKREVELKRKEKRVWQLRIDLIRQRDYLPDPTGNGLYEMQEIEMDYYELLELAESEPDVYDVDAVKSLQSYVDEYEERAEDREKGQNTVTGYSFRKRVRVLECWGNLLNAEGTLLHRNAVCAIANDRVLIRKPQPNPFWHGRSPFVTAPILRVPHSVWHKALMDAPTALNQAMNEIYNLIFDSGVMNVFGVRQIREGWIDNIEELSDGVAPGTTIKANTSCPPGQKVVETVSTSTAAQEAMGAFNLTNAEFQASALTNDLRMGVLPSRAVKATEVVEASQSITSVFSGVAKQIEHAFIEPLLDLSWLTMLQDMNELDSEELIAQLGEVRARALQAVKKEERFAKTINGHRFKVFGITQTLNKMKDFRKLTSLLQTISGSEVLTEEFSKTCDFGKLLQEIMKSLDINVDKIKHEEIDQMLTQLGEGQNSGPPMKGPDMQSQTPQMSATSPEGSLSALPHTSFPRNFAGPSNAGGMNG